jgi:hypothetical protein
MRKKRNLALPAGFWRISLLIFDIVYVPGHVFFASPAEENDFSSKGSRRICDSKPARSPTLNTHKNGAFSCCQM